MTKALLLSQPIGLLSLASQLTTLANEVNGAHIHYDEHNSLEEGSSEMIIEKI